MWIGCAGTRCQLPNHWDHVSTGEAVDCQVQTSKVPKKYSFDSLLMVCLLFACQVAKQQGGLSYGHGQCYQVCILW